MSMQMNHLLISLMDTWLSVSMECWFRFHNWSLRCTINHHDIIYFIPFVVVHHIIALTVLCSSSLSPLGRYWGGGIATNIRWSNRWEYHRQIVLPVLLCAPGVSAMKAEEIPRGGGGETRRREERGQARGGGGGKGIMCAYRIHPSPPGPSKLISLLQCMIIIVCE